MAIRLHSPLILYSWIHLSAEAILTAVMAYGITKIHSPYKITKTPSTVEACSLSAASFLFMSRRCGRRAGSQWGILHGHVIWALCLDTAHEGQTYLWRAHCETATGKRRRRGVGFHHWIDLLWKLHVFYDAFTPRCCKAIKTLQCWHAKCISILNTGLCILQHWYHLADVQVLEELKWGITFCGCWMQILYL